MHCVEIDERGVARLTLARPEVHNAFNDALIAALTQSLEELAGNAAVRAVVLAAEGKSFSAGADLNWMKAMAGYDEARNLADARGLSRLLWTLDRLPKPTIARVQGAALGGGVGLVACCDIVVASRNASFTLSEVKLGLIPATIGPYVAAAIGERACRRYFLTAERIFAEEALRLGLVHRVVESDELDRAVAELLAALLANGPAAVAAAKELIFAVGRRPVDAAVMEETARRIAAIRVSPEGREGIAAFLEKRKPGWTA
jgi:methylglutaconyl-CoA hydratase